MKNTLKKLSLTGLFLLSIFGIVSFVNGAGGSIRIVTDPSTEKIHKLRLHSLYLMSGDIDDSPSLIRSNEKKNLDVSTGLIVGKDINSDPNSILITIGGGEGNKINNSYAGIAGGDSNTINGDYSAIGGGNGNASNGENSVIAGGINNKADDLDVVIGGKGNAAFKNSIILGGQSNVGKDYSLVLGLSAKAQEGFAWNDKTEAQRYIKKSARISANSGILIGTLNPITGVNLVVSGAVIIGEKTSTSTNTLKGKIFNTGGCIDVYYKNSNLRTLGRASEESPNCNSNKTICKFGNTILQNGDVATGYTKTYTTGECKDLAQLITCNNSSSFDEKSAYCYKIADDPFLNH